MKERDKWVCYLVAYIVVSVFCGLLTGTNYFHWDYILMVVVGFIFGQWIE